MKHSSKKLREVGLEDGVASHIRKGEWQLARDGEIPGGPKSKPKRKFGFSSETLVGMREDSAGGMSNKRIAKKYHTTAQSVESALAKRFGSASARMEALKNVVLDNAIGTNMVVRKKIPEMTVSQAVVAAGVMTDRAIALDKHTASKPQEVNFKELEELNELMRDLTDGIDVDNVTEGEIIDISVEKIVQNDGKRKRKRKHI